MTMNITFKNDHEEHKDIVNFSPGDLVFIPDQVDTSQLINHPRFHNGNLAWFRETCGVTIAEIRSTVKEGDTLRSHYVTRGGDKLYLNDCIGDIAMLTRIRAELLAAAYRLEDWIKEAEEEKK